MSSRSPSGGASQSPGQIFTSANLESSRCSGLLAESGRCRPGLCSSPRATRGLAVQQQDWQGALQSISRYLQLDPQGSAHIWYYSALSNFQLGNLAAPKTARTSY